MLSEYSSLLLIYTSYEEKFVAKTCSSEENILPRIGGILIILSRLLSDLLRNFEYWKIWIDWNDFQSWVRRLRVEIAQDDPVVDILRDLARKRSGS